MKISKMISIDLDLVNQVSDESENFSAAITEALKDWLDGKHAGGLTDSDLNAAILKLEARLEKLKEERARVANDAEVKAWYAQQSEALKGTISKIAEEKGVNWDDIAREYMAGTRKVVLGD